MFLFMAGILAGTTFGILIASMVRGLSQRCADHERIMMEENARQLPDKPLDRSAEVLMFSSVRSRLQQNVKLG